MASWQRAVKRRWVDVGALVAYVVLSLVLTWPLPLHLSTHVAGRYVDTRIFQWNNWWVKHALLTGHKLEHTDYIYYPSGVSLVSHNFNWVSSFLSVPLDLLLGSTVTYNLLFLVTFFLSAFGMYLLVRHVTGRRDAAFLSGLVFAFSPYHVSGNFDGQMNLANVQWLPLFLLFLLRTTESARVRDALLTGVFLALASLDCWFFLIFLGMWVALWVIYTSITERWRWKWRKLGLLTLAGLVGGALMLPFLAPLLADLGQGTVESALAYHADDKGTDLLAFFIPARDHPLLGGWVRSVVDRFQHWRPAFLGYLPLALAGFAVAVKPRRSLPWLLSGLAFAALALGTQLQVNGVAFRAVPTPYRGLINLLPAFKIIRQANRFNVMVSLALAVLVGIGSGDILKRVSGLHLSRRPSPRQKVGWQLGVTVALLGVVTLIEYLAIPCPLSPRQVSPFYLALASDELPEGGTMSSHPSQPFAILELPIDDFHSRDYLYPQTLHQKKLVNGYVARMPPGTQGFILSHPLIKALQIQMEVGPGTHDIEKEIGLLAANDIRYVVVHKRALPPQPPVDEAVLRSWQSLLGDPVYEDEELIAYPTHLAQGYSQTPLLRFGEQLGVMEVQARRTQEAAGDPSGSSPAQILSVELTWRALRDLEQPYACRLALFRADGDAVARAKSEVISPRYPTPHWPPGVVIADRYALPLEPGLPGGEYVLAVEVLDLATGVSLGSAEYPLRIPDQAELLAPALKDMQHPEGATFGDEMRLLGYTPQRHGDELEIDLYWLALRAMTLKYKVFVHLIRMEDETIAVQHDAMPRDWSYPTSMWARREVFVDRVELDLRGVEPGSYRLAVGVYQPETNRLVAVGADGALLADRRALLSELIEVQGP